MKSLLLAVVVVAGLAWVLPRLVPSRPAPFPGPDGPPPEARRPLTPEERAVLARMDHVLPRDAISPIYAPRFVPAHSAQLDRDEMVIGVTLNGAAKAYPLVILGGREMVNDTLGGIPILVTW